VLQYCVLLLGWLPAPAACRDEDEKRASRHELAGTLRHCPAGALQSHSLFTVHSERRMPVRPSALHPLTPAPPCHWWVHPLPWSPSLHPPMELATDLAYMYGFLSFVLSVIFGLFWDPASSLNHGTRTTTAAAAGLLHCTTTCPSNCACMQSRQVQPRSAHHKTTVGQ
jgi:hypothetical protein